MAVTGAVLLLTACIADHARDAVPGDRGGAAGGRHRDADLPARPPTHRAGGPCPARSWRSRRCGCIGDWSYSLYLWHWPAFILLPVALDRAMTPFEKGLAVLVVITLSAYSYRFVEMPFRAGRPAHRLARRRALVLYPASAVARGRHRGRRLVVDRLPGRRARRQPADHGRRRPDRRAARQHRGAGARVGHRRQGQAGGAERPHPRPAQPAQTRSPTSATATTRTTSASCARTATATARSS